MSTERTCPNCHAPVPADAPAGACPACALRAGFFSRGDAVDVATLTAPGGRVESPRADELPAEELAGRLPELEDFELLGRGGMGSVYRARHRRLDRPVAVKILDPGLGADPAFAERFVREARTLARLDHPNIVRVYDFDDRDGLYFLVMELVDGVDLRQLIRAGHLEARQALALVPRLCDALQYAHDRGVVHRDIKPENILVNRDGVAKIADFGLAKLTGDAVGDHLTRTRQVMGTPNYMAPEQVEQPEQVDHRADIFALGVVLYELLTGELPLGRFPAPSHKVEIDVRLDEVVMRTLEKEPGLRYQRASELGSDVSAITTTAPPPPVPPTPAAGDPASADDVGYDYTSKERLFGLPLIHICFSRDPEGHRVRVARGVIAIGDVAVGGLAIGGLAIGGVAIGGASLGLIGFGGLALGLLVALGGFAGGLYAVGGSAMGVIAHGRFTRSVIDIGEAAQGSAEFAGWLIATLTLTLVVPAAGWAAYRALRDPRPGPGPLP
ncbi:MAG: serine/threonine-protein kinase [Acidobacteriota bacterium]